MLVTVDPEVIVSSRSDQVLWVSLSYVVLMPVAGASLYPASPLPCVVRVARLLVPFHGQDELSAGDLDWLVEATLYPTRDQADLSRGLDSASVRKPTSTRGKITERAHASGSFTGNSGWVDLPHDWAGPFIYPGQTVRILCLLCADAALLSAVDAVCACGNVGVLASDARVCVRDVSAAQVQRQT